jgi:hypothetical protein
MGASHLEKESLSILEAMGMSDLDTASRVWGIEPGEGQEFSMGSKDIEFVVGSVDYTYDSKY